MKPEPKVKRFLPARHLPRVRHRPALRLSLLAGWPVVAVTAAFTLPALPATAQNKDGPKAS